MVISFINSTFFKQPNIIGWLLEHDITHTAKPQRVMREFQRFFTWFPSSTHNLDDFKLLIRGKLLKQKRMRSKKIIFKDYKSSASTNVKLKQCIYSFAEAKARIGVFAVILNFTYINLFDNE